MKRLIYLFIILLLISCSKNKEKIHYYLGEDNLLGIIKENKNK